MKCLVHMAAPLRLLPLLLAASALAGADDCNDEPAAQGDGWTITAEEAGGNCALGGIRIDGGAAPLYVCNGAPGTPGASPEVSVEPPGEHCAQGGLQVVAESGPFYLCHGEPAPTPAVTFCGEGTLGGDGSGGSVVAIDGIAGGADAPATADRAAVPGAIQALGTCHAANNPYDPATGVLTGQTQYSPYGIISHLGPEMPQLLVALFSNEVIPGATVYHDGLDSLGDPITPLIVDLQNVQVAAVHLFSHPDPRNPARYATFQRVALSYTGIGWEWTDSGVTTTDDEAAPSVTVSPALPCAPTAGSLVRQFVSVVNEQSGPVLGDATLPGEEGAIAGFGVCHTYDLPMVGGNAAGNRVHGPLTLVKGVDSASTALFQSLLANERLTEVSIRFYRADPAGVVPEEQFFRITLQNGRVYGITQTVQEGVEYERIELGYDRITWESLPGGATATDGWAPDPA